MEALLIICGILLVVFIYSHAKRGKNLYKQNILSSIVAIQQNPFLLAEGIAHSIMSGERLDPITIVCIYLTTFCFIVKGSSEVNLRDRTNIISIVLEDTNLLKDFYSVYLEVVKLTTIKGRFPEAVDMKTFIDIANHMIYEVWRS